jgi:capsular polysaccharide export protein
VALFSFDQPARLRRQSEAETAIAGASAQPPSGNEAFSLDRLPAYRNVLLLQGPAGPFFRQLGYYWMRRGARVTKVNFHAGDDFYFRGDEVISFRAPMSEWPRRLREIVAERHIHKPARALSVERGVALWAFEEGYIRPDYVTLERGGVNCFSALRALTPEAIQEMPERALPKPNGYANSFSMRVRHTGTYFVLGWMLGFRYPHYRHHKPIRTAEAFLWARALLRKHLYAYTQRARIARLLDASTPPFFLVPLQVQHDSQITRHSAYGWVGEFIEQVVTSFAAHAPAEALLVFKHHPMDRGHTHYGKHIRALARHYAIKHRVFYVHDAHMPSMLRHACGCVLVNSTTAMQALYHGVPVIALGEAFFSKPGLTYQGGLDDFWRAPGSVDRAAFMRYRAHIIATTQLNGCFHAGIEDIAGARRAGGRVAEQPAYDRLGVDQVG